MTVTELSKFRSNSICSTSKTAIKALAWGPSCHRFSFVRQRLCDQISQPPQLEVSRGEVRHIMRANRRQVNESMILVACSFTYQAEFRNVYEQGLNCGCHDEIIHWPCVAQDHRYLFITERILYFVLHCHVVLFPFFLCFGLFYQVFHFESSLFAWR